MTTATATKKQVLTRLYTVHEQIVALLFIPDAD